MQKLQNSILLLSGSTMALGQAGIIAFSQDATDQGTGFQSDSSPHTIHNETQHEKPNILWISVEDISPDLSCYGATGISTPNIDRLAREGILYRHAYATVGVSGPSRSSVITGMYPVSIGSHNMRTGPHWTYRAPENEDYMETYHGLYDHRGRNVPHYATVPPPYVRCFTEFLRMAGYYTTNNAKTDYQFNPPLTAWDENGQRAHYLNRPSGSPFFAVFNHEITHESRIWAKKDDPMLVNRDEVPVPAYFPVIPSVVEAVSRNYSNITELDRIVGRLLDELEAEGLLEKTIIFFWSDHGGPLLRQKRAVGNSGLHVPLIVRMPGGEMAGTEVYDIVSLMDLGPTVLSLAGITPPDYMHGRAFLGPYKTDNPHKYAFGSADRFDEVYDMSRSAIDGRYVYIRNFRPELPLVYRNAYREQIDMTAELLEMNRQGKLEGDEAYIWMKTKPLEELYDLQNDPWEVNNLAECPEHQDKLIEMRTALARWQLEVGDLGFVPEHDLVQMMWPGLVQPETAPVTFTRAGNRLELASETEGASIAWQIGGVDPDDQWRLYHKPIETSPGNVIRARAIRIGYKTSGITIYRD
jgi:N-sulfoglucosamine sulfohydrolase